MRIGYNEPKINPYDSSATPIEQPWTQAQWLAYLDGWGQETVGVGAPPERADAHPEHYAMGQAAVWQAVGK